MPKPRGPLEVNSLIMAVLTLKLTSARPGRCVSPGVGPSWSVWLRIDRCNALHCGRGGRGERASEQSSPRHLGEGRLVHLHARFMTCRLHPDLK